MSDAKKTNTENEPALASAASLPPWWRTRRAIALWVVVAVGLHALGYSWYIGGSQTVSVNDSPEVDLGKYHFISPLSAESPIERADFQLHVALLKEVRHSARDLIDEHRFRVVQNVEELLRRAHGGDFDDPSLTELKRQLQETINKTVGHRVIEEVIITQLALQRRDLRSIESAAPAQAVKEKQPPAGNPGDTAWLRGE